VARDQTAEADQQKCDERRQHGEPMQPRIGFRLRVCVHSKNKPPRFFKRDGLPNLKFILTEH
jgi:hypothetical protein